MAAVLAENRYGKSRVRLVTVRRPAEGSAGHELKELTIAIHLEGDFAAAYADGDNGEVLPTDTMKNTVYALAGEEAPADPESFGRRLAAHFLATSPRAARATIEISEHPWERLEVDGKPHPTAFRRAGSERRTAVVIDDRKTVRIEAGVADLVVMKTAKSAFAGFPRDRYTTLKESTDRLLATALEASWKYAAADLSDFPFGPRFAEVRRRLLDTFAEHDSLSVQHTLYAMGEAALAVDGVEEIRLALPNKHHIPIDLTPFKLENKNEVFVATEEPFGLIEATLRRG
jgi:urate oxidase